MRVSVIGGGVIGLTIALRLSQRGIDVSLFDSGCVGGEASWAGAGILPAVNRIDPLHALDRLKHISFDLHAELAVELLELTGIDNQWSQCGGIHFATTLGEAAALRGSRDYWNHESIPFRELTPADIRRMEPALGEMAVGSLLTAFLFPDETQIRNPKHLQALIAACRQHQVEIHENCEILDIDFSSSAATLISDQGRFTSERVCVAAGAWASRLLQPVLPRIQVVPVKGHMLLFRLPQRRFTHILNNGNRYIVPRNDGLVLVGSNEEESGFDKSPSQEEIERLLLFAEGTLADLNTSTLVDSWTGLRPMSFDQMPFVGRHSEIDCLFVATGHFRSGLHLSTGTAHLITQLICGEKPTFDITALRPSR
ncbi:MAG: glycine oxidase ThiO [Pirellulaceae bacterium]|jgi:glycine oxidase|nr:glycine oxidase ThiO [Pirellulaceae bacterium]